MKVLAVLLVACSYGGAAVPQPLTVSDDGAISVPAITIPSSSVMSAEGNRSRAEHIQVKRSLAGKSGAELNGPLFGPRLERIKAAFKVSIRESSIGGVPVLIYETAGAVAEGVGDKILVNLHGGGFAGCFTECGGLESIPVAAMTGMRVVSIDYRISPAAQFPAASEDVAAVYRELLTATPARNIGIFGCSSGGVLTAQSLVWFQRHNLPRPAVAGIFCAGADPTMSGDSGFVGSLLGDGAVPSNPLGIQQFPYMRGASVSDPQAFPAADPAALAAFPPTLIISGTRDYALSGAVSLHSKLVANGVDARLHVWEGGRHAFFYDVRVPEAQEAYRVMASFFLDRLR
jgi:acetyl esterase/lipase